ncbi:MAG: CvpA family protein [Alphaproteobacteria bacterium]|nr:CvpA family protein [Alphaproteobacteria bacterium]
MSYEINMFDIIAVSVCVLSAVFASYRGFLREVLGLVSWALAAFAVILFLPMLQPYLADLFPQLLMYNIIVGCLIAMIVLVINTIIISKLTRELRKSSLSGLDRTLGLVFGALRGVLLIVASFALSLLAAPRSLQEFAEKSYFLPWLNKSAEMVFELVPEHKMKGLLPAEPSLDDIIFTDGIDITAPAVSEYEPESLEYDYDDKRALEDIIHSVLDEDTSQKKYDQPAQ